MKFIVSTLTNQFFLMFLAIVTGLLIGEIKIRSFFLGVSGGVGFSDAKRILSSGVVAQVFFTFFLLLFLVSIGLKVGSSTASLSEEQIPAYKGAAASAVSLGYTVAFPIGVLVIVLMISLLTKIFRIDMEKEKAAYQKKIETSVDSGKKIKEHPLNFMLMALVVVVGIIIGNITIPLGGFGSFSLGAACLWSR